MLNPEKHSNEVISNKKKKGFFLSFYFSFCFSPRKEGQGFILGFKVFVVLYLSKLHFSPYSLLEQTN